MERIARFIGVLASLTIASLSHAASGKQLMASLQGDYRGTLTLKEKDAQPLVAQLIALGKGTCRANVLRKFDTRDPAVVVLTGALDEGRITLKGRAPKGDLAQTAWDAVVQPAEGADDPPRFTGHVARGGETIGTLSLHRVIRRSPALGAEPPEHAIVLFDGTSLDAFVHRGGRPCRWTLLEEEKAMEIAPGKGGVITKRTFTDHKLHIEFRLPFEPAKRGQGRGNSGVYLQGRYEVQVLDSYGLEGRSNECGGVYGVDKPRVNMCAPPLQWQTYDITFRAPRFDEKGKKTEDARMTVVHNGVAIHSDVTVPHPTTACWDRNITKPGGLHVQDHGHRVRYRNIWAVELAAETPPEK
jgi:hypothetical protein